MNLQQRTVGMNEATTERVPLSVQRRRAAWRRRLIDIEHGFRLSLRGDSTFFVHAFVALMVLSITVALGPTIIEWAIILLAMTVVLTAEMFLHVLKLIAQHAGERHSQAARQLVHVGMAAVCVTIVGASLSVVLILGAHLCELF